MELSAVAVAQGIDDLQRSVVLLVCSALVILMSFGAALVYLRPSRAATKTVLTSAATVSALWVLCGYGLSFGPAIIPGLLGDPLGLVAALASDNGSSVLHSCAFALFQGTVLVFTVTLVTGVVGDRVRLGAWLVLVSVWTLLVYVPLAYSMFNTADGWLFDGLGIVDQAGGTVVHISAGAALIAVFIIFASAPEPPRTTLRRGPLIGAMLLWAGSFGFNLGSEGVIDRLLVPILLTTLIAPVVSSLAWMVTELLMRGRVRPRGVAFGLVAGAVASAPTCGILTPLWTVALAVVTGGVCSAIATLSQRSSQNDDRAPIGIHLVGGIIGVAYIGLFGNGVGWKDSGQPTALATQTAAAIGVAAYSFLVTFAIAWALRKALRLQADAVPTTADA